MRKLLLSLFLVIGLLTAQHSGLRAASYPPLAGNTNVAGRWMVSADFYGTPIYFSLELKQAENNLTGTFSGDKLEGAVTGNALHFVAKDEQGGTEECQATVQGGSISGSIVFTDADDRAHPSTHEFTATLVPPRPAGPPQRHEFTPTVFYRQFSPFNKPVLNVSPGDTVHTTTVDAGGTDEKGVKRVLGGNPETGPFYIESAVPGDTLVVRLEKVRLNRDWAVSDDAVVDRGLDSNLAVKMKDGGKTVRWHLDLQRGVATPEKPGEHLAHYSVPLKPMLGCVATATGPAQAPPGTGDSGRYGGNMDFNEIVEGATLYLPVSVPGALLYLGDGHAAQGDGELNGNALETSMEVEFTVDVIPAKRIDTPRVESATHIMAVGLAGSIDDAFREATAGMSQWLTDDYKLTPSEVAEVLGTSAEYKVNEVADRNAGVVLKINKERLLPLAGAAQAESQEYGATRLDFAVPGGSGFVIKPTRPEPAGAKPWVWYAPTFVKARPEMGRYPNKSLGWLFTRLLDKGIWIAGVDVGESWGNAQGREAYTRFYEYVRREFDLSPKPCLLPQSRGGLMLYNWAAEHAVEVGCIAAIYPVTNLTGWPDLGGEKIQRAYGMNAEELRKHLPENNPIDRLAPLAEAKVPIFQIHGDADKVVPLEQNTLELARRYKALGGNAEVEVIHGKGHEEVPEYFQSQRLLDFLLRFLKPS